MITVTMPLMLMWLFLLFMRFIVTVINCTKTQDKEDGAIENLESLSSHVEESSPVTSKAKSKSLPTRKPHYFTKTNRIQRKAMTIFESGEGGVSFKDAVTIATKPYDESRREAEKRRKEKETKSGVKRNHSRHLKGEKKELFISRHIANILNGRNGVFRHEQARKIAEDNYLEYNRAKSARYRQRVKQQKDKQKDKQDDNKDTPSQEG